MLPQLVQNLVSDLTDAVESRIRSAFDVSRISKELISKGSFSPRAILVAVSISIPVSFFFYLYFGAGPVD